jgi:hypothetical protein
MKQQIRKIAVFTLLVTALYIFGVFDEISFFSLLVIVPVCITYIILVVRIVKEFYNKNRYK